MARWPRCSLHPPGVSSSLFSTFKPHSFFEQSSRENGWTVTRPDGTWIDGKDKGLNAAIFTGLAQRGDGGGHRCDVSWLSSEWNSQQPPPHTPVNPLAMGHLINHPPRNFTPNAAFHSIDVPHDVLADPALRWFVPCVRYMSREQQMDLVQGQGLEKSLPGLGVISTRDIAEGEEVFCNYNFDADCAPEWYTAVG